jgi:hypothetical protein
MHRTLPEEGNQGQNHVVGDVVVQARQRLEKRLPRYQRGSCRESYVQGRTCVHVHLLLGAGGTDAHDTHYLCATFHNTLIGVDSAGTDLRVRGGRCQVKTAEAGNPREEKAVLLDARKLVQDVEGSVQKSFLRWYGCSPSMIACAAGSMPRIFLRPWSRNKAGPEPATPFLLSSPRIGNSDSSATSSGSGSVYRAASA